MTTGAGAGVNPVESLIVSFGDDGPGGPAQPGASKRSTAARRRARQHDVRSRVPALQPGGADLSNYYSLGLLNGRVELGKNVGGTFATRASTALSLDITKPYTVKLECNGTSLTGKVYDDATHLATVTATDSCSSAGKIGLWTKQGAPSTTSGSSPSERVHRAREARRTPAGFLRSRLGPAPTMTSADLNGSEPKRASCSRGND